MDLHSMYLVNHVLIFQEVQVKLVLFTCIGAVFWSLHGTYEPYDTRKNFLIDRLVGAGLRVRSLMLFLVSCPLAAQGNRGLCFTMGVVRILMNLNWEFCGHSISRMNIFNSTGEGQRTKYI